MVVVGVVVLAAEMGHGVAATSGSAGDLGWSWFVQAEAVGAASSDAAAWVHAGLMRCAAGVVAVAGHGRTPVRCRLLRRFPLAWVRRGRAGCGSARRWPRSRSGLCGGRACLLRWLSLGVGSG
jgi:hypothetical protein